MRVIISIEMEGVWLSGSFNSVRREIVLPNAQGIIHFDVSHFVDANLEYFIPDHRMRTIQECQKQSARYRIGYSLNDNTGVIVANTFTDPLVAIKGGYERTYLPGNTVLTETDILLTTELVRQDNPLYPRSTQSIRYVPHELRYVYFLCRATATPAIENRPRIAVQCQDNDDNVTFTFPERQYRQWRVYCIPINLPIVLLTVPPNPLGFVLVMSGLNTENLSFFIDKNAWYDTRCLLYRNSLGGLGTLTLRGEIDWENDYERTPYTQVAWPEQFQNGILRGLNGNTRASETQKAKGVSGFIGRGALDALRDIFLAEEVWEYIEGYGLTPVTILNNKAKLYSNRDNLFALEIEWAKAATGRFVSPLPYPAVSCPGLTLFSVRQASRSNLEILWSMPEPYYNIQVEIIINAETTTVVLAGTTGRTLLSFDNPMEVEPIEITVRGRVVCNPFSSPMETGAWTTVLLEILANLAPIAVNDTVTIASGFNTPIELPVNVLENDYDPDGDAIECIPMTEQATAQGGELSLAADGTPTYLPPSSIFTGTDTITYEIQEVALPNLSASAVIIIIVVGEDTGPGMNIYLRIVDIDIEVLTTSTIQRVSGKRYVYFYSDPAGTVPLDLTGQGISFEVVQTHRVTDYDEFDVPNIDETVTATTYTASGIRQLLRDGMLTEQRIQADRVTRFIQYLHAITPSAQFTIIP